MKSKLFSKNDYMGSESFVKDMKKALSLESDTLTKLPDFASRLLASSDAQNDMIYDQASEQLSVPRSILDDCISITSHFFRQSIETGAAASDKPEDIASDIQELFHVPEEKRISLITYFNRIKALSNKETELAILRKTYSLGSLPNLQSMSTVVDFRAVFDKTYKQGMELDSFSPKFLGTIPMAIVRLKFDQGPFEEISFQTDKDALRRFIEGLIALEKEIDIAQSGLGLREV